MQISTDDLEKALNEVAYLRKAILQYSPVPTTDPYSLDEVQKGLEELTDKKIIRRVMPFGANKRLRGLCLIFQDRAEVYLDADQKDNWLRYVGMKEYAHVLMHDAENVTVNPGDAIEYMVFDEKRMLTQDGPPTSDVVCETLAKFVAIETLFPFTDRKRLREENGVDSAFDGFKISEQYELPRHVIEFALTDMYMDIVQTITDGLPSWND